jgi:hypothetical protein
VAADTLEQFQITVKSCQPLQPGGYRITLDVHRKSAAGLGTSPIEEPAEAGRAGESDHREEARCG